MPCGSAPLDLTGGTQNGNYPSFTAQFDMVNDWQPDFGKDSPANNDIQLCFRNCALGCLDLCFYDDTVNQVPMVALRTNYNTGGPWVNIAAPTALPGFFAFNEWYTVGVSDNGANTVAVSIVDKGNNNSPVYSQTFNNITEGAGTGGMGIYGDQDWAEYIDNFDLSAYSAPVPEPSGLVVLLGGLVSALGLIRRRK